MRDQLLALMVVIGATLLGWMVLQDRGGKRRGRGHEGRRVAMGAATAAAGSMGTAIPSITGAAGVTAAAEGMVEAGAMVAEAGTEREGRL